MDYEIVLKYTEISKKEIIKILRNYCYVDYEFLEDFIHMAKEHKGCFNYLDWFRYTVHKNIVIIYSDYYQICSVHINPYIHKDYDEFEDVKAEMTKKEFGLYMKNYLIKG